VILDAIENTEQEGASDMPALSYEEVVRNYLAEINDPESLVDEAEVKAAEKQLKEAKDPMERILARQALHEAQNPPSFEDQFIQHAKAWADKTGIVREVFEAEGVSARVLDKAGFGGDRGDSKPTHRVTREEIIDLIKSKGEGTFTVRSITDESGASQATVRKTIAYLQENATVEEAGPEETEEGTPGRAATAYRLCPEPVKGGTAKRTTPKKTSDD